MFREMHVCFTLPEYQQEGITLSAPGFPNFMEDERFWHRLAENKIIHTTAGMEQTGDTSLFYPGNIQLQSDRLPYIIDEKKACTGWRIPANFYIV